MDKQSFKPRILICSVCGRTWEIDNKEEPPCKHIKALVKEIRSDPKFKEW